jgi:hypothetical protein
MGKSRVYFQIVKDATKKERQEQNEKIEHCNSLLCMKIKMVPCKLKSELLQLD